MYSTITVDKIKMKNHGKVLLKSPEPLLKQISCQPFPVQFRLVLSLPLLPFFCPPILNSDLSLLYHVIL